MPSIEVTPENLSDNPAGGGPVIGGVEFRRPTSRAETTETLRQTVDLGNGSTRTYDRGVRGVYAFTWGKLVEAEVEQLRTIVEDPYVTLAIESGRSPVVVSTEDGLSADPIAGTYPVRYSAALTLRERDPR